MNSQFEYQESLNSLHFTEEEKAAIARRAAEAARKQTRPARRPVRRIALIAAAAVLVLAVVGNFVTVPEGAAGAVLGFVTSPVVLVVAAGVAGLCVRAAKGGLRK